MPREFSGLLPEMINPNDFILMPLPNHLFTRDTSSWFYNGVALCPMTKPTRRGEEVSASVIDGPQSVIFDQAKNRLHTATALLFTMCYFFWTFS